MRNVLRTFLFAGVVAVASAGSTLPKAAEAAELTIETYNPGTASVFPVSSTIIEGPTEVILVDAQFQRNDAQALVDKIKATGKELTTVFISHGDPDYYFGLDVITQAFPDAQVLSSTSTQKYIQASMEPKNAYWGPILGENAPQSLVVPDVLAGDALSVDGQAVNVIGLDGHDPKHTFLWVPSVKAIVGGVSVFDNMHAWMADSQTEEARQNWYKTLDAMDDLQPEMVIPGHYLGDSSQDSASIQFIRQYLKAFEAAASDSTTSEELIAKVKKHYPDIGGDALLSTSAKVFAGEMKWP